MCWVSRKASRGVGSFPHVTWQEGGCAGMGWHPAAYPDGSRRYKGVQQFKGEGIVGAVQLGLEM